MRARYTIMTSAICLALAGVVLLSASHAKDVAGYSLPSLWLDAKKQADDAQNHIVKVASELHDHTEKSLKIVDSGDNLQADNRSLRLHDHKKDFGYRNRLAARMRLWWELHSLRMS